MSYAETRIRIENEIFSRLERRLSEEEQANHLMSLLMDNYPLLSAAVLAADGGKSPLFFAHRGLSGNFIKGLYARNSLPVIDAALEGEVVLRGSDPRLSDPAWRFEHESGSLYAAPCRLQGETLGVFLAESADPELFSSAVGEEFRIYARLCAVYLSLHAFRRRISRVPDIDSITGLNNFKFFHEVLHQELTRGKKLKHPVSLVFLKVRHLREMNDVFGHVAADKALAELARVVREQLREVDYIARSGSMIFVVMPQMGKQEAAGVARNVLDAMNAAPAGFREGMLRLAVGVASFPKDGETERVLVPHVEAMVHESARKGDNAVTVFKD